MLARIPGMYIAFEACRLIAWLVFFGWYAGSVDPATWVGIEAGIPFALAAFWLGWPWGWLCALVAGDWAFLPVTGRPLLDIAAASFVVWLCVTVPAVAACVRWRRLLVGGARVRRERRDDR